MRRSMEIWRSEWATTIQMQALKKRIWTAMDHNKKHFVDFALGDVPQKMLGTFCTRQRLH